MATVKLLSIIFGVCLFTVPVRYSIGQIGIQIVKLLNIGLIYLYKIIYGVCLFTLTVRYSVYQLDIQIEKVRNIALIYLFSNIYEFVHSLLQIAIQKASSLFKSLK